MTVVTAQGPRVLAVLAQRVARLPEPGHSSYRAVGRAGPVILVISGAARSDSFTYYAAFAGPNQGAAAGWLLDGNFQQRADIHGRQDGHPGIRNTLPTWAPSSTAPLIRPVR
jgi:hypothetical protein